MMPAGTAKSPMPSTAIIPASSRPSPVIGNTSPYPTFVSVAIAHHAAAGMLEKTSGCAPFSA